MSRDEFDEPQQHVRPRWVAILSFSPDFAESIKGHFIHDDGYFVRDGGLWYHDDVDGDVWLSTMLFVSGVDEVAGFDTGEECIVHLRVATPQSKERTVSFPAEWLAGDGGRVIRELYRAGARITGIQRHRQFLIHWIATADENGLP